MRTIVQLSDLHFGMILQPTLEPLIKTVWSLEPDLVIISGDLTQRATEEQFREARAYIARLPQPQLLIPGNHDVPLYDVFRRFAQPLDRYKEYITSNLSPVFIDDELAVVGINTARSLVFKGGRVSDDQLAEARRHFDRLEKNQVRIVVTHHPFDIPEGLSGVDIVMRAQEAMTVFAQCGVEFFLAGHLHLVFVSDTARYGIPGFMAPILQAGTPVSTRARGEPNSFFVMRVDRPRVTVDTHSWDASTGGFSVTERREFAPSQDGWKNTGARVVSSG